MSATFIYQSIAIVGGVLLTMGLIRFFRQHFERAHRIAAGETQDADRTAVPRSPLEQRAWWGLVIALTTAALLLWLLVGHGSTSVFEHRGTRLTFLAISSAGIIAYLVMLLVTRRQVNDQEPLMDERDRKIMDKASSVQLIATFAALVAWTLVLTEVYWEERAIPLPFADLILWSTFLASILARFAGILIGYRIL